MSLQQYFKKRNFKKTSEPRGGKSNGKQLKFVVQEHWASHLHYDFRLEMDGVLKSWAVPKGPSTQVGEKRLAVEVEDHPLDYAKFKGTIPEGEYGAGTVKIWDHGTWLPKENTPQDLHAQLTEGHLEFHLQGKKLKGRWLLQRTGPRSGAKSQWLLIKGHDRPATTKTKVLIPTVKKSPDPLPTEISPQLAQLVDHVPAGDRYIHEIKLDGYRTLVVKKSRSVQYLTRNGHDWSDKYNVFDAEIKKLKVLSAVFDGEIVVLNEEGHSDFSALQSALKNEDVAGLIFYVFDLLYVNGHDITERPLEERKQILKSILTSAKSKTILFSEHVRAQGQELFEKASKLGLEGIISKDRTLPYRSGRSSAWQKIKTSKRQELVIGGYTDPEGSRKGLGALLMGVYEGKRLRYVGRVGTGFNSKNTAELTGHLERLNTNTSPFHLDSPRKNSKIHWVKPKLVSEIEFKAWTAEGILRHASFLGLRQDKVAKDVVAEMPKAAVPEPKKSAAKATASNVSGKVSITHPERIVYPAAGVKKIDVANYYKSVAPWILPHISDRPLSLLRCPDQADSSCFFQKHVDIRAVSAVSENLIRDQKVISANSEEGLLQLVQWGVIEPHTWQCHIQNPLSPDQIIFDLDPDEHVPWSEVVRTSLALKALLEQLELKSFVKTTGGKGLHIHVPIAPLYTWEQVKQFSKTLCQHLATENPEKYTVKLLKKDRQKKIFLDYLRNGFGATAVAPFSLRARPRPSVAVPLAWRELKDLRSGDQFDLTSTLHRLARQKKDPWEGYFDLEQKVSLLE